MNNNNDGIGFLGALCLLFIGLKLGNVIDWSWWWVLSPMWLPLAFAGVCFTLAAILRKIT
jgi:hypothetical protein